MFDPLLQLLSYEMAPRAQMFRRDAAGVTDLHSLRREMRYNEYDSDKVQMGLGAVIAVCSTKLLALSSSRLLKLSAALAQGLTMPLWPCIDGR